MTENHISFEEFERLLINTCNHYTNDENHNYKNKGLLSVANGDTTLNDYIQLYKFMIKNKDKNKIQNLEKEIEDLKYQNNILYILCSIILIFKIINLLII